MNISLTSGFGQFHTNEVDPEKPEKKLKPYVSIDLAGIKALVDKPQGVAKAQAQWLIPSTLPSREFKRQEQYGKFWLLWADLDKEPLPVGVLAQGVDSLGCFDYEIYTSRSATQLNQKSRLLIPLNQPLSGAQWLMAQDVLNDKLTTLGANPDTANLGCGQLCYLPNAGEFYQSASCRLGNIFNPFLAWSNEIAAKQQEIETQEQAIIATKSAAQARRAEIVTRDHPSIIEAFNAAYSVHDILQSASYTHRGNTYRHPASESGSFSASVKDGRVHSLSSIDPLYSNGEGAHDAFSAFQVLFAGGDQKEALKLAGDQWLSIGSESWNQVMRREYQNKQNAANSGTQVIQSLPFTLEQFSLNGKSQELRKKMLEDKFILGKLAILGQSTTFYAKPNAGKTLLTIWMLGKAINDGEILGRDVFYINADDNFKGLVTKLSIAETLGFNMLAPGHNGFKAEHFRNYVQQTILSDGARGKVIILDTVKKFVDLMDKRLSTEFGKTIREFVLQGGSVIMLAHVNKHRDGEGKVVFAGTSDLFDDVDCAYTLDVIEKSATGEVTVLFENFKSRGDVAQTSSLSYERIEGKGYEGLLATVREISQDDVKEARKFAEIDKQLYDNREAINAILSSMEDGLTLKTEIIADAANRSIASTTKIKKALIQHTGTNYAAGHRWSLTIDKVANNAHIYKPLLLLLASKQKMTDATSLYSMQSNGE
jgi:hypothetical protein